MATPPKDHDPDQTPPIDQTPPADHATDPVENRDVAPTTTVITPEPEPASASRARRFRTPAIVVAASLVGLLLLGGVFAGGVAVGRFSDRGDRGAFSSAEDGRLPGGPGGRISNDRGPGNHAPGDMTRPTDPRGGDVSDSGDDSGDDGGDDSSEG